MLRRRIGGAGIVAVLALAGAAPAPGGARADIILPDPPKSKRVGVAYELDWGVLADRVSRPYVVRKGDTVSSIAERFCGSAARWKAIADANPGVLREPDRIRADTTLWLPPIRSFDPPPPADELADPKRLAPWYDAFRMEPVSRWQHVPGARVGPDAIPAGPAAPHFLVLRHGDAHDLLDGNRAKRVAWDDPVIARGAVLSAAVSSLAHADDPTVRIVARVRVTGIEGRRVTADVREMRFDAKGQVVEKAIPLEPDRRDGPTVPGPGRKKEPGDAPAEKETRNEDIPPPPAATDVRWPLAAGVLVALAGGVAAAIGFLLRRRAQKP